MKVGDVVGIVKNPKKVPCKKCGKLIYAHKCIGVMSRKRWCSKCKSDNSSIYHSKNKYKLDAQKKAVNEIHIGKNTSCESCGTNKNLERHHFDYSKPTDVIVLCRRCHLMLHFKIRSNNGIKTKRAKLLEERFNT